MTLPSLDLPTVMMVSALAIAFAGVMLSLARWRDRQANALALWGGAMMLSAAGLVFIVAAPLPRPWAIAGGDAVLVLGAGLSWAGGCLFASHKIRPSVIVAGPVLLLAIAAMQGANIVHLVLTVSLVGAYTLAAAIEIRRTANEALRSRRTAVVLALLHAGFQFARALLMAVAPGTFSAHAHAIYTAVFLEALLYAIGMSTALLSLMKEQAEYRSTIKLRELTRMDELTGLGNRRLFDEALARLIRQARDFNETLALLMIDVDHFKMYNDTYGHLPGDACLRAIAAAIQQFVRRPEAIATRYGGEEFAVLLAGTDEAGAMQLATRIHGGVAALAIKHANSPYGTLTVSIGVAAVDPSVETTPHDTLVRQADWALYVAKSEGRNATRAASETRETGVLRPA
jgi:diguanylate cyclase (GGDEF)-like protein